jgi:DNA-binding response OmpR family regulator
MAKVLIIEDDPLIAEVESDFLEIAGYEPIISNDGLEGLKKALSGEFDLIILDIMLPGLDGLSICKQIRNAIDVPILMVSAKIEDGDKIRGLGLGADDYITKPFSPSELVARVKANLAQYERLTHNREPKNERLEFGDLTIDPDRRRVYVAGREVELTNKEYDLLMYLISRPDIVLKKEVIYEQIWGPSVYGDVKTVAVHIKRLREKIENDPSNPVHIQTVWGVGYRFCV